MGMMLLLVKMLPPSVTIFYHLENVKSYMVMSGRLYDLCISWQHSFKRFINSLWPGKPQVISTPGVSPPGFFAISIVLNHLAKLRGFNLFAEFFSTEDGEMF
jgi:hypothetical protein